MKKCDLLIVTAPVTDTDKPLQAPALIKSSIEQHGFVAYTDDLNWEFLKSNHPEHNFLKQYFAFNTTSDYNKIIVAEDYAAQTAKRITDTYDPKYIAVSVFTYQCQTFSMLFAQHIKKIKPSIKIIFG